MRSKIRVATAVLLAVAGASSIVTAPGVAGAAEGAPQVGVLDLAQAYQIALKNNTDVAIARETLIRAELTRTRSYAALKPLITANGNYTRNSVQAVFDPRQLNPALPASTQPIIIQRYDALFGAVKLRQPILAPSAIVESVSAGIRADVTKLDTERVRQQVLLQVARAYYDAVAAGDNLKVAVSTRENREEQARKQRILLANGAAVETAVLQAELDVAESDRQILEARASQELAFERLRILLSVETPFTVAAPALSEPAAQDENALIQQALQLRPDMRSANKVVSSENIIRWEARAKFFPELNFDFNGSGSNAASFAGANFIWSAVVSFNWTLYDGGARYADVKSRASDAREATIRQQKTRLQVIFDVRSALIDIRRLSERWKQSQREAELARKNEVAVKARFDNGTATPLEQSDAGTRRLQSEVNEISTRYALQSALAALDFAVGKDVTR
jgi:outer membrane protein TolC